MVHTARKAVKVGDDDHTTLGERASDAVADFGGSWKFIILFAVVLTSWVTLNTLQATNPIHWDNYPYILLNLFLSFIAAFQAPFIMMSQNRQSQKDRKRQIQDLEIDEQAKAEIDDIQAHLHFNDETLIEVKRDVKAIKNSLGIK